MWKTIRGCRGLTGGRKVGYFCSVRMFDSQWDWATWRRWGAFRVEAFSCGRGATAPPAHSLSRPVLRCWSRRNGTASCLQFHKYSLTHLTPLNHFVDDAPIFLLRLKKFFQSRHFLVSSNLIFLAIFKKILNWTLSWVTWSKSHIIIIIIIIIISSSSSSSSILLLRGCQRICTSPTPFVKSHVFFSSVPNPKFANHPLPTTVKRLFSVFPRYLLLFVIFSICSLRNLCSIMTRYHLNLVINMKIIRCEVFMGMKV
jgi:hypothetical protein